MFSLSPINGLKRSNRLRVYKHLVPSALGTTKREGFTATRPEA